jgi:hypothetical protein
LIGFIMVALGMPESTKPTTQLYIGGGTAILASFYGLVLYCLVDALTDSKKIKA